MVASVKPKEALTTNYWFDGDFTLDDLLERIESKIFGMEVTEQLANEVTELVNHILWLNFIRVTVRFEAHTLTNSINLVELKFRR